MGLKKIKSEMKQHQKPQEYHDKFHAVMKEFYTDAEEKYKKLSEQHALMEKRYEELSSYYCFDRKKVSMEEFFGDLTQFCKEFEVSY